jgi:hypothetical protein
VSRDVLVAALVTLVLRDEVKVLATDDDGAVHLREEEGRFGGEQGGAESGKMSFDRGESGTGREGRTLVETTLPVRMRPRMETRPVKGHFLSM